MRKTPRIVALFCALGLALAPAFAAPLAAAGPELTAKAFDVKITGGVVDMSFALNLSEVTSYPITITAICCSTEEVLFEGTLDPGVYHFSAPLTKFSGHGDLLVVLRTRVTNRSDKGNQSYAVYLKWQGPM